MIPVAVAVVFGAVSAVAGGAVVWGRFKRVKAVQDGAWDREPAFLVERGVSLADAREAAKLWRGLGYQVRDPVVVDRVTPGVDGTITLRIDESLDVVRTVEVSGSPHDELNAGPEHWDVTHVRADDHVRDREGRRRILSADIRLHPNGTGLAVAHALGHALGHQHPKAPPSGVLMYPGTSGIGRDLRGLECVPWKAER